MLSTPSWQRCRGRRRSSRERQRRYQWLPMKQLWCAHSQWQHWEIPSIRVWKRALKFSTQVVFANVGPHHAQRFLNESPGYTWPSRLTPRLCANLMRKSLSAQIFMTASLCTNFSQICSTHTTGGLFGSLPVSFIQNGSEALFPQQWQLRKKKKKRRHLSYGTTVMPPVAVNAKQVVHVVSLLQYKATLPFCSCKPFCQNRLIMHKDVESQHT